MRNATPSSNTTSIFLYEVAHRYYESRECCQTVILQGLRRVAEVRLWVPNLPYGIFSNQRQVTRDVGPRGLSQEVRRGAPERLQCRDPGLHRGLRSGVAESRQAAP